MARDFVNRADVLVDGSKVENIKNIRKGEVVYREIVQVMDGSGTVDLNPEHTFSFDYVLPKNGAKWSWNDYSNSTVSIASRGGFRIIYTGATVLREGDAEMDGQKEMVMTIYWHAQQRSVL